MAKVSGRPVPERRHLNRRKELDSVLRDQASTGPEVLAAAAAYFRGMFHRVDAKNAMRLARQLIEMTDREAGEKQ